MAIRVLVSLLAIALGLVTCYENPGSAKVDEIKQAIRNQLAQRANRDFIPTIVRLAFHDCVGEKCDGCINLATNPSNAGLAGVIEFLDGIYVGTYDGDVSRADFWQIANMAAIEQAVIFNNNNCANDDTSCRIKDHSIAFKWGRQDCPSSPSTNEIHIFPGAQMDRATMMAYFKNNYGFSEAEVVALMGAHTLGNGDRGASGYFGSWVRGETTQFNNHYYALIVNDRDFVANGVTYKNRPQDRTSTTDRKFQFNIFNEVGGDRVGFMLPTDMELAYNIDVDPLEGTSCRIGVDCEEAPTIDQVKAYAADNDLFMNDFSAVMQKVSEFGYTNLELVV